MNTNKPLILRHKISATAFLPLLGPQPLSLKYFIRLLRNVNQTSTLNCRFPQLYLRPLKLSNELGAHGTRAIEYVFTIDFAANRCRIVQPCLGDAVRREMD